MATPNRSMYEEIFGTKPSPTTGGNQVGGRFPGDEFGIPAPNVSPEVEAQGQLYAANIPPSRNHPKSSYPVPQMDVLGGERQPPPMFESLKDQAMSSLSQMSRPNPSRYIPPNVPQYDLLPGSKELGYVSNEQGIAAPSGVAGTMEYTPSSAIVPSTDPIGDATTYTTQSGGTVSMPSDVAADVQKKVEQQNRDQKLKADGLPTSREQDQAAKIRGAKEGIAARALTKSLEKQGMKRDEIAKEIGWTEGMSSADALKGLKQLQTTRRVQTSTAKIQRQSELIASNEERSPEGAALNNEAKFVDLERRLSGTGPDPEGKPILDQMSPSNKRDIDRLRDKVASGRAKDRDFTRINKLAKDAEIKADRKYNKDLMATAKKTAKTQVDQKWIDNQFKELKSLEDRIKRYDAAETDDERKKIMPGDQYAEYQNRRGELLGNITSFNKSGTRGDAETTDQQGRKPVGQKKDASGKVIQYVYADGTVEDV